MLFNIRLTHIILSVIVLFVFNITAQNVQGKIRENFSHFYVFGDSFTYQDTWANVLANEYKLSFSSNNVFATGGSVSMHLALIQLPAYRKKVGIALHQNALYSFYAGASDHAESMGGGAYARQLELQANIAHFPGLLSGAERPEARIPLTDADIKERGANIGLFVKTISDLGAKNILIFNHFNESYRHQILPIAHDNQRGQIWRNLYNQAIYENIERMAPNANVIYVDYNRLIEEIAASPASYLPDSDIAAARDRTIGFFDGSAHPTKAAHKITANYVASILEAPARVAYAREAAINNGLYAQSVIENLASKNNAKDDSQSNLTATPLVQYQLAYSPICSKRCIGDRLSHQTSPGVMINYSTQYDVIFGGSMHYFYNHNNFYNDTGHSTVKSPFFSVHIAYNNTDKKIFAHALSGMGKIDYDIQRNINLGRTIRAQKGTTSGEHYITAMGVGYTHDLGGFNLSPFVNITYQTVTIKDYQEKGELKSTRMSFKIPKRESLSSEIGLHFTKDIHYSDLAIASGIKISYVQGFKEDIKKMARAHVSDMPKFFSVQTYETQVPTLKLNASAGIKIRHNISLDCNLGMKINKREFSFNSGISTKMDL